MGSMERYRKKPDNSPENRSSIFQGQLGIDDSNIWKRYRPLFLTRYLHPMATQEEHIQEIKTFILSETRRPYYDNTKHAIQSNVLLLLAEH